MKDTYVTIDLKTNLILKTHNMKNVGLAIDGSLELPSDVVRCILSGETLMFYCEDVKNLPTKTIVKLILDLVHVFENTPQKIVYLGGDTLYEKEEILCL